METHPLLKWIFLDKTKHYVGCFTYRPDGHFLSGRFYARTTCINCGHESIFRINFTLFAGDCRALH